MTTHMLRRLATCLLVAASALTTGCVEGEKELIIDNGVVPPALKDVKFINVCKGGACLVYWTNHYSSGKTIGGQIIYRDMHLAAFEALGDGRHWIARLSSVDGKFHSYTLLREDRGTWTAYDFDVNKFTSEYLRSLAKSGFIEFTEKKGLFGLSKEVRLINRPGLLRFMRDMAKLSSTELSTISAPSAISAANSSEAREFMREIASSYSRAMLPDAPRDMARVPLAISSGGCPGDLPSTVVCTQYDRRPADPVAPMGPIEVLYFHRDDCGHCQRIREAIAEWQLRLPDGIAFARHIANERPIGAPSASLGAYDLNRVPALVINRKYKIELDTSEPGSVKIALDLALRLAGELKR